MIKVYNQTLSPEFCQMVIDMFDKDPCKVRHGHDIVSLKYNCAENPEWIEINNMFRECRDHFLESYFVEFPECDCKIQCGGYEIARYSPVSNAKTFYGVAGKLSAVWFLNSVDVGGSLILREGDTLTEIKPQMGRLIIFPNDTVTLDHQISGITSKYLTINNISEVETPAEP